MEQTSLATGNGNDVVDTLPGEGLAVNNFLFARVLLFLLAGRVPLLLVRRVPERLTLLKFSVTLLSILVFLCVNDDGATTTKFLRHSVSSHTKHGDATGTYGIILDQQVLGDLEEEEESKKNDQVATPQIGGLQRVASGQILLSRYDGVASLSTNQRANLIGSQIIAARTILALR